MEAVKKKNLALIVDDEKSICETLAGVLQDEGWDSVLAYSGYEAIQRYRDQEFGIVFLDIWMKHFDGLETLQQLRLLNSRTPIVVMSGHAKIETAVKATKFGAVNFLEKPLSLEKILPILKIYQTTPDCLSNAESETTVNSSYNLIGASDSVTSIHRQIKSIARRNSWVLITGENGTGKEVVARNIHLCSQRVKSRFVAVNCAAIPEELIESELFGHAKGAFTHATSVKTGKFELADKGTLFLDEIGDMSLKTQAKILRILQEQAFQKLGDNLTIKIDVRVVAATNKDLCTEIRKGRFREDLYYRLNVIPIHLPPLRERVSDIPILVEHFLTMIALEFDEEKKSISTDAVNIFKEYEWPGNVRELKNIIERLYILVNSKLIGEFDVQEVFAMSNNKRTQQSVGNQISSSLKEAKSSFERSFIMGKLEECNWNISKTADLIGLERSNLHRKMRSYEISFKKSSGR